MTRWGEKTESTRERRGEEEKKGKDRWSERKTDKGTEKSVMESKAWGRRWKLNNRMKVVVVRAIHHQGNQAWSSATSHLIYYWVFKAHSLFLFSILQHKWECVNGHRLFQISLVSPASCFINVSSIFLILELWPVLSQHAIYYQGHTVWVFKNNIKYVKE